MRLLEFSASLENITEIREESFLLELKSEATSCFPIGNGSLGSAEPP